MSANVEKILQSLSPAMREALSVSATQVTGRIYVARRSTMRALAARGLAVPNYGDVHRGELTELGKDVYRVINESPS